MARGGSSGPSPFFLHPGFVPSVGLGTSVEGQDQLILEIMPDPRRLRGTLGWTLFSRLFTFSAAPHRGMQLFLVLSPIDIPRRLQLETSVIRTACKAESRGNKVSMRRMDRA
jgi:hypothetical protein